MGGILDSREVYFSSLSLVAKDSWSLVWVSGFVSYLESEIKEMSKVRSKRESLTWFIRTENVLVPGFSA